MKTKHEGSTKIEIPAQSFEACNSCDYLQYNHDYNWQMSEYECKKDSRIDLDKRNCGFVVCPENCPLKKAEQ